MWIRLVLYNFLILLILFETIIKNSKMMYKKEKFFKSYLES